MEEMSYADSKCRSRPARTHLKGRVPETEGRLLSSKHLKKDGAGTESRGRSEDNVREWRETGTQQAEGQ